MQWARHGRPGQRWHRGFGRVSAGGSSHRLGLRLLWGDPAAASQTQELPSLWHGAGGGTEGLQWSLIRVYAGLCPGKGLSALEMKMGQGGIAQRVEMFVVFHQALPAPEGRSAERIGICCA